MDAFQHPPLKPVFDWNNVAVGRICAARLHPRTRAVASVVVTLTGEAQRRLQATASEMVIPVAMIHSIRPGEVVLDRPLERLRRGHRLG